MQISRHENKIFENYRISKKNMNEFCENFNCQSMKNFSAFETNTNFFEFC